jgi:WD40 repeat protein
VTGVAFSRPDARHLLTTCRDGRARFWDLSSRAVVALVEGVNPDERPAFSPGGKHFMTVGRYNNGAGEGTRAQVTLWRPEDLRAEVCRRVTSNLTPEDWAQYTSYRPKEKVCPGLP